MIFYCLSFWFLTSWSSFVCLWLFLCRKVEELGLSNQVTANCDPMHAGLLLATSMPCILVRCKTIVWPICNLVQLRDNLKRCIETSLVFIWMHFHKAYVLTNVIELSTQMLMGYYSILLYIILFYIICQNTLQLYNHHQALWGKDSLIPQLPERII